MRFRRGPVAARQIVPALLCCLTLLAIAPALDAAWGTRPADARSRNVYPLAFVANEGGDELVVSRNADNEVRLSIRIKSGFRSLSRSSCPTFQIDRRIPMHFFEIGNGCNIGMVEATYNLGRVQSRRITSLILHRLMNGSNVAFRYTTQDGTYHEARFPLTRSKRALRNAIGRDTRVVADE